MAVRAPSRRRTAVACVAAVVLLAALVVTLRGVVPSYALSTRVLLNVAAVVAIGYVAIAAAVAIALYGPTRGACGRVALAVGAGAVVVAALELPALLFDLDWRRFLARQDEAFFGRMKPWKNPWNVADAELVFRRPPSTRVTGRARGDCVPWLGIANATEYDYDLTYDARGYRNGSDLTRAGLAVLGDSFVEAAFVATDDLFTTRLERALGTPVANLGIGGYGPQQELVVLRREALRLQPRVVLWLFFEGNDLNDARRYELDAADPTLYELKPWTRSFTASAAGMLARAVASPLREDRIEARRSSGVFDVAGPAQGTRIYFPYPARRLDEDDRAGLVIVTRTLAAAQEACAAVGTTLVLLFVPEKYRVLGPSCRFEPDAYPRRWTPSELPAELAEWCRGASLEFVDLTPDLASAAARGELVYYADDGHWSAAGHAVVAQRLERELARSFGVEARR